MKSWNTISTCWKNIYVSGTDRLKGPKEATNTFAQSSEVTSDFANLSLIFIFSRSLLWDLDVSKSELNSEPTETLKTECFAKTSNGFNP